MGEKLFDLYLSARIQLTVDIWGIYGFHGDERGGGVIDSC